MIFVWGHSRPLRDDEAGLSLLAYALGAALIVAPLVIAIVAITTAAGDNAGVKIQEALDAT